ncbi:OLC1v1018600C1 [Oldenlandia corymbosa var. corymbosa]|uniref:OLC1v1018600C1 n=1 Tax=Oldenlandia corymbosa var. corymbosa TaxID=529605 RepID=A0AAV1EC62_OLDCO|nr:OLC1v1018600C1 [Oldenlandia corymbosa var. corymbosa]
MIFRNESAMALRNTLTSRKLRMKNLPQYCTECKKVGHRLKDCRHADEKTKAYSSGLTVQEKENILIDIENKNPITISNSSAKRNVSKEQLSALLENSKSEEPVSMDGKMKSHKRILIKDNGQKQPVAEIPQVKLPDRFAALENLQDDSVLEAGHNDEVEVLDSQTERTEKDDEIDSETEMVYADNPLEEERVAIAISEAAHDDLGIGMKSATEDHH